MDFHLRAAIRDNLIRLPARAPALMQRARTEKLFEIFILSCLVRSLNSIGAQMSARDRQDHPTTNLVFRMGPGYLSSPTTSPGFIYVDYQGREYEIQNGIQVQGQSSVLHELDVCLIDRKESVICRDKGKHPNHSKIKFLAECKYYGASLGLDIGREMIGLGKEFGGRKIKTIVANIANPEIHTMVTKHDITENFEVTPLMSGNVERFVQWLANELRQIL
jgi:hypothetical protein